MAMTTCPNCGKPLRPGVRFCGNCGATIPAERAGHEVVKAQPSTIACPNCGKPVRAGAKFCNYCGKEIPQAASGQASPLQEAPPTIKPTPPAEIPARPRKGPPPIQTQSGNARGKSFIPILGLALAFLCLLAVSGGYIYLNDPFNLFGTATESPTETVQRTEGPLETPFVGISASDTPEILLTQPILFTETIVPTETSTATIESTAGEPTAPAATIPVTSSVQLTSTVQAIEAAPSTNILIDDEFSTALNEQWIAWGNPRPTIRTGFGDSWLDLKAADQHGQAGVTSRAEVPNAVGTEIEFEAQLNTGYPLYPLILDWDPLQFDRGPENNTPTVIHIEIHKALVSLKAPAANNSCQSPLDGTQKHIYLIKFPAEKTAALYVDDASSPVCEMDIGIKPVSGRISYTGTGWVTRIIVTGALLP